MDNLQFFAQFYDDRTSTFSIVIEDDGRVAYAYMLRGKEILSDVWLYNRAPAPKKPEWVDDSSKAPFLNPADYALSETVEPLRTTDVTLRWTWKNDSSPTVDILIKNVLFARLSAESKPGWAKLAKKDSPVARILGKEK